VQRGGKRGRGVNKQKGGLKMGDLHTMQRNSINMN